MDNIQARQESSTKKKLLVPIVVLILLGVGLAGAAYAYSSSVSVDSNTATTHYLTIDLKNGSSADMVSDATLMTFTEVVAYDPDRSVTVNYNIDSPVTVAHALVKVVGDTKYNTFTVTSDIEDKVLYSTTTIADYFDISYIIKATDGTTPTGNPIVSEDIGDSGTIAETTANTTGTVYYVEVIATANSGVTGEWTAHSTAAAAKAALSSITFNVTVDVGYETA